MMIFWLKKKFEGILKIRKYQVLCILAQWRVIYTISYIDVMKR